jgi:hypothetical protein
MGLGLKGCQCQGVPEPKNHVCCVLSFLAMNILKINNTKIAPCLLSYINPMSSFKASTVFRSKIILFYLLLGRIFLKRKT